MPNSPNEAVLGFRKNSTVCLPKVLGLNQRSGESPKPNSEKTKTSRKASQPGVRKAEFPSFSASLLFPMLPTLSPLPLSPPSPTPCCRPQISPTPTLFFNEGPWVGFSHIWGCSCLLEYFRQWSWLEGGQNHLRIPSEKYLFTLEPPAFRWAHGRGGRGQGDEKERREEQRESRRERARPGPLWVPRSEHCFCAALSPLVILSPFPWPHWLPGSPGQETSDSLGSMPASAWKSPPQISAWLTRLLYSRLCSNVTSWGGTSLTSPPSPSLSCFLSGFFLTAFIATWPPNVHSVFN